MKKLWNKSKKTRVIIIVVAVVLVIALLMSCGGGDTAATIVNTVQPTRGSIEESISTSGTVVSEETQVLFAPVSGMIATVNVAAGDVVCKDDVLVTYNMEEMDKVLKQAQLQQTQSNASYQGTLSANSKNQAKLNEANVNLDVLNQQIADNKALLKSLQNELETSQRETANALADESYHLTQELAQLKEEAAALDSKSAEYAAKMKEIDEVNSELSYNEYVQSTSSNSDYVAEMQNKIADVQETIADYEEYKARMESQKTSSEASVLDSYDKQKYAADNELATMTYEQAVEDYNAAQAGMLAPFDGVVTECTVVQGATIAEGTQLLTIQNGEKVKVSFSASKYDVEKLEEGQKASITIAGNTYEGEVSKINRMATVNASNTPMVGVEVHITNPDDKIILGLDAKLEIHADKVEDALLIPMEAINADKDGDFLYVVENGVVVKRSIVCGISSDEYTEVVEGISETDQIIISAYSELTEGMAVTALPQQ